MPGRIPLAALFAVFLATSVAAEEPRFVLGGDSFTAGMSVTADEPSARDAFLSGFSVELGERVEADFHGSGFDVDVEAPVGGDLYAGGFSVEVNAPVSDDLTAMAANLELREAATVGGNARILAGNAVLDAAIAGSLLAAGGSIELNGSVAGDARLTAGDLTFGPSARIGGVLTYFAPEPIEIPASVVPAERIRYEKLEADEAWDSIRDAIDQPVPSFWPSFLAVLGTFVLTLAFLLAVGAAALAFAPKTTDELRGAALAHPFRAILLGALGLSMLVGLVPVSAMTLIGIPLIPVVLLVILLAWIIGYLLGVYAAGWKVAAAFGGLPGSTAMRLGVLAAALVVFALLNFIPVLGWLINLVVIFLGLGAMMQRGANAVADRQASAAPARGRGKAG